MKAPITRPVTSTRLPIAPDTALLCATIVLAPELFGGAFSWTIVVIASLSVASLGMAIWVRRAACRPVVDGLFVVMGTAWVWTCFQAVPLPSRLAGALRLASVRSAERLQDLAWVDSVPLTVSYDRGSTYLQILTGICILSAFIAARLGGPSGLKPLAVATVISAVLIGLVGFAHELAGVDVLFGVYSPRFTATRLLAPLMNTNHLAGFSLLGALSCRQPRCADTRASRGAPLDRGIRVLHDSRSMDPVPRCDRRHFVRVRALAAWLAGTGRSDGRGAAIPVAVVGAAVAGVVAFAGLQPILTASNSGTLGKLEVAARGLRLLDGSPWWLGVGRGAFLPRS